ncbi:hypothetical protein PQX77_012859 [Marasmius sp. AFHP31]|nr:hypothetical protein PQX77_012859 [Marasmius sp. AFHP31]
MRLASALLTAVLVAQTAFGHYVFDTVIYGNQQSTAAIRRPISNGPVEDVTSNNMRCNVNPTPATQTVSVAAGSTIGFKIEPNNYIGHPGPGAIYLGKAPSTAASWDGSGANWFKIAEWGARFDPQFEFIIPMNETQLTTTIPASVPAGEYLARVEHLALHQGGQPQWYISCAQIKITGGGNANPTKVSIPGYVAKDDPGITINIWWPTPTAYTVLIFNVP